MKKYKTWEVIKMISENKGLEFENKNKMIVIGGTSLNMLTLVNSKYLSQSLDRNIDLDDEWELVKKPVSFEEVLNSKKRCKVEHEILNQKEITSLSDFMTFDMYMLNLCDIYPLSSEMLKTIIREGKWYLED
jgi:hypothetical protein